MKIKSVLPKILVSILLLAAGIYIGKSYFSSDSAASDVPSTMKYRNVGLQSNSSQTTKKLEFTGQIILVKDGESIQKAVQKAKAGDIIKVYPGTYPETVFIDKDDITLEGIIENGNWPTLDGNKKLNDAFLYSGNGITIQNFKIIKFKGNGIMGQAGNNFLIQNNWIIDTGVYGIFPQYGKNGLIEHNILSGIEDAAIYVGMCDNVDVRHNEVFENVAGIEIENSRHCLVEFNTCYNNTGGILAFVTPGLPIKTAFDIIIRNNFISNNNHKNFGAPGSIVSGIPAGTGILIMAADDVILENNIITGNNNSGITIVDLATGASTSTDVNSEPNPDRTVILDNVMFNNGNFPNGEVKALMLTKLSTKGPDIIAVGGGTGSTMRSKNKYRTFGIDKFGKPSITTTQDTKTMMLPNPVEPRSVSKKQLGEITYYGVCAGCHSYDTRLIGIPTKVIQMIYANNPKGMVEFMKAPKHLREDYPEMPPQNYLSDEAKLAVAEYILTIKE